MNQNELYLVLMAQPALFMMMAFIAGLAVVCLTDSDELIKRVANALSIMFIVGGMYEIAMVTYVLIIQLIN